MKRFLVIPAVLVLGLALAKPALANHYAPYRGHGRRVARTIAIGVYRAPRFQSAFSFGFGLPIFGYASYYSPAPVYYAPAPVYYPPAPVLVAPPPCRVWVPGHYIRDRGGRFYIQGRWSNRRYGDRDRYDHRDDDEDYD
ncbi:MAG TPA: hypothetical protein VFT43_02540 [Candidatus Polarisedimenticolia bacterium]|nr:hypothetical protein [Candidatus Polarisedimenticolia bacterium]